MSAEPDVANVSNTLFARATRLGRRGPLARSVLPYALLVPALVLLAVGLVLPLLSLFDTSLRANPVDFLGAPGARSADAYGRALDTPLYREAFVTTVLMSVPAALISVALAYPVAFYVAFRAARFRNLLLVLIIISTFASFIVRVFSWRIILGDGGIINRGLEMLGLIDEPLRFLIYSRWAVFITWVGVFTPLAVLILVASMSGIRAEVLDSARDLGAGSVRVFTRVLLPLTMNGAVGAFVLVLIFAASDFVTPAQIGGNIVFLGEFISDQFQLYGGDPAVAAALAFLLMGAFAVVYVALSQLERFKGFCGPSTPKALERFLDRRPRRRRRNTGLRVYMGAFLVLLFAPLAVMTLYAFHSSAALGLPFRGFSLQWFDKTVNDPEMRLAGRHSLEISLIAAVAVAVIGTMAALATARHQVAGRKIVRILILAPILLPSLLYAIALLSFFNRYDVELSLWTVALGHTVVLLPVFYIMLETRLRRFDPLLEEAARDLGATASQSFSRVTLPLIAPTIFGAMMLSIASSWDELPIALFNSGNTNTVPLLIYTRVKVIVEPTIDAIAVLLLLATVAVIIAARRVVADLQR